MAQSATRGVVYAVWGEKAEEAQLRSQASLGLHHPELPVHLVRLPGESQMIDRAHVMAASPFEETLFLDADTVVLARLDYAFEQAKRFGIALCINENPWAGRCRDLRLRGDAIEYNTGVIFFTRRAQPLLRHWIELAATTDNRIDSYLTSGNQLKQVVVMGKSQPSFALAVEELGILPFVLPLNWNFRPMYQHRWQGPLKIWHDYRPIPAGLERWNDDQTRPDRVIKDSLEFFPRMARSNPA